jgi:hypothetical protein
LHCNDRRRANFRKIARGSVVSGVLGGVQTEPETIRLTRAPTLPGGSATWQVVGRPFRVVALDTGWLVIAVGGEARRALVRADLLGRPFPTRRAAASALSRLLAHERPAAQSSQRAA